MTITSKDILNAVRKYKNLQAKKAEVEAEMDTLKEEIRAAMGGDDTATCKIGGMTVTITNKEITSTRLDTKAVKSKYPKVYEECTTTSTSPRFVVK